MPILMIGGLDIFENEIVVESELPFLHDGLHKKNVHPLDILGIHLNFEDLKPDGIPHVFLRCSDH